MTDKPLTELIDQRQEWAPEDWWRLELRSLQRAPMVQRDLALLAPKDAVRDEYTRVTAGSCLQSLAYLFSLIGPLIGAVAMIRWMWTDGRYDMPLGVAGMLTSIALLVSLYSAVREHRHPRAASMYAVLTASLMRIIPGVITLGIALTVGRPLLEESGAWWLAPIAVDIIAHVIMLIRGQTRPGGPQNPVENVQQGVTELAPALRGEITAERHGAIDLLRERGLITAEQAATAQATALGLLALTVAPEVKSDFAQGHAPRPDAPTP